MLPRNIRWIHYAEAGKKHLALAIKHIESEVGIKIKDRRDIEEINSDMFQDTTHLARYKDDDAYTNYLFKQY